MLGPSHPRAILPRAATAPESGALAVNTPLFSPHPKACLCGASPAYRHAIVVCLFAFQTATHPQAAALSTVQFRKANMLEAARVGRVFLYKATTWNITLTTGRMVPQ